MFFHKKTDPKPDKKEPLDQDRIRKIANKTYPGITLFARDVNLPPELAKKYTPGLIIRERAFVDASIRFMGMVTTHRYVILSNHMASLAAFEHGTNWGLHIANTGSHFKVLGTHVHNGKTGIFLLHLPDNDDWKVYRNAEFDLDQKLYQWAVERFVDKADGPAVPELATPQWLDRCAFPLGMDDQGNLFDPNETIPIPDTGAGAPGNVTMAEKLQPVPRPKASTRSRFRGCLLGGAVGDALGYPVEFRSEPAIFQKYGPGGIRTLEQAAESGGLAVISDDTQMALFAANGCLYGKSQKIWGVYPGLDAAWLGYREWLGTQGDKSRMDADGPHLWLYRDRRLHALRAPGNTCLNAIRQSEKGGTMEQPINQSKGCGTVMRAAPYGLFFREDPQNPEQRFVVHMAACDAALTHGHPLAWGSSGWLAGFVFEAVQEFGRQWKCIEECMKSICVPEEMDPEGKLHALIDKAFVLAVRETISDLDAIHMLGEGWVAEEALAIAVFCAVRYQNDFAAAIRAAVNHKGDSDSTGAICGNILGAWLGEEAVEQAFNLEKLELRDVIETIAEDLYRTCGCYPPKPGEDRAWDERYRF